MPEPVSAVRSSLAPSPVTLEELDFLKRTVFFTEEDASYLRLAGDVVADQLPEIIEVWFSAHPYLYQYFRGPDGKLIWHYVEAVRQRSAEWILESCRRTYDQAWLDYTYEVGLRHHRTKKNVTDQVVAPPLIPLRYVIAFSYHTIEMLRPFLGAKGHAESEVQKMHQAWRKSVILQIAVWSYPYVKEGDW
jgi:hypothetical protein